MRKSIVIQGYGSRSGLCVTVCYHKQRTEKIIRADGKCFNDMLMLCPICAGEFQTRLDECPGCGVILVPGTFDQKTAAEIEAIAGREVMYVELCRPRLYPVAMLIKQMLEQNSVNVIIQGGHSLSVMPHLAYSGELRVLVEKEQLEFAHGLYKAYFESNGDEELDYMSEE